MIALGSDFDGIDGPHQLENAAFLPLLVDALRKEGFTEAKCVVSPGALPLTDFPRAGGRWRSQKGEQAGREAA